MTDRQHTQTLRVGTEVWRRSRMKALSEGVTMTAVVQAFLEAWVEEGPVPMHPVAPKPAPSRTVAVSHPPARQPPKKTMSEVRELVATVTAVEAEARCAGCQERRSFHTGGQSGTIGRNNCRAFMEGV